MVTLQVLVLSLWVRVPLVQPLFSAEKRKESERVPTTRLFHSLFCISKHHPHRHGIVKIPGQGHCHLRIEQHRRPLPQLPSCTALHCEDFCSKRRLWRSHRNLQLYGSLLRHPHLRHGDFALQVHQPFRRGQSPARIHHRPLCRGSRGPVLPCHRGAGTAVHQRSHGLCHTSRICDDHGMRGGTRCLPGHPIRISPVSETAGTLCTTENGIHRPQHRAEPHLLPGSPRCHPRMDDHRGTHLLYQPLLHGNHHAGILARNLRPALAD